MPVTPALDMEAGGFSQPHTHSRSAASLGYGVLSGTFHLLEKKKLLNMSALPLLALLPENLFLWGWGVTLGILGFS